MTGSDPQNTPGDVFEGPPVKRPCMNDTPPIALTPGDDGSDFYNTPWTAGTPVTSGDNLEDGGQPQATEPTVSSNPSPLIPGLSLVNDTLKEHQTEQNEKPAVNGNMDTIAANPVAESEAQISPAHAQPETREQETEMSGMNDDAMQVEEDNKQQLEETANANGNVNGAIGAYTAEATEQTQLEQEEGEEEHPEWEIDSSPYESSSDSSSTDSSDDSDEDEDYPILSPEEQARILMQGELGSDDEGEGKGKSGGHLRTANEVVEDVLPIPDIKITPEMKIVLLGNVEAVVENTILIAANVSGEYQVLEAGSLLCLEDRQVAGVVSETLGRVENPLYAVRFPTAAAVEEQGLSRGTAVYYVVEHSTFVFTQPLKGMKGSDASNFHDEEVAEDEVEFSDDEQEAEYKRRLKQKRQERKDAKNENGGPSKTRKGPPGPSKLSQSELNYDDNAAEDGYTPLARPKNLHEMMRQEAPVEGDGFPGRNSSFRGGRGRGRGSERGRGGRGGRGRGGPSRDPHEPHRPHHDRQPYYQHERPEVQAQAQHYPAYNQPQQFPSYLPIPQQQPQQQPHAPGMPTPFNFQMPFQQQAYQPPNLYQQIPPNAQINPLFLAALQQQQQQQQQQHQQQQHQQAPGQPQTQSPAMNFDQVKAQLDLLRQLSNGNQWPPRS
ncbi:hypothetical protein ARAM_005456 [Aspergillus rambellii]|uniref:H/ACA ribonucleoprotein complex non-core subunit NAF1 n=1 Tax=Aspergillus rambellii TaxID=308745 RepID=A0A0F8WA88_9EURO|nr:hypothetical protein ARAM_005456 [Aspergillus rambellii]